MRRGNSRTGFTLVELMVASILASMLLIALFRLLDITLDLWSKGETRRAVMQQTAATAELLASDLRALHNGQQGDLFFDRWCRLDQDQGAALSVVDAKAGRVALFALPAGILTAASRAAKMRKAAVLRHAEDDDLEASALEHRHRLVHWFFHLAGNKAEQEYREKQDAADLQAWVLVVHGCLAPK